MIVDHSHYYGKVRHVILQYFILYLTQSFFIVAVIVFQFSCKTFIHSKHKQMFPKLLGECIWVIPSINYTFSVML